jgi:RHS repeat-associated protein
VYDGQNTYADFNGAGALLKRYLYGPAIDAILARTDSGGTSAWYLTDKLGTVRDITSESGTVIDHVAYDSFGQVTNETSSPNGDRFKFVGREYDSATGLYFDRARNYDPATGRFLSRDPMGFRAGDANLYRYVGNGPVNWTDPTGLMWPTQFPLELDPVEGKIGSPRPVQGPATAPSGPATGGGVHPIPGYPSGVPLRPTQPPTPPINNDLPPTDGKGGFWVLYPSKDGGEWRHVDGPPPVRTGPTPGLTWGYSYTDLRIRGGGTRRFQIWWDPYNKGMPYPYNTSPIDGTNRLKIWGGSRTPLDGAPPVGPFMGPVVDPPRKNGST